MSRRSGPRDPNVLAPEKAAKELGATDPEHVEALRQRLTSLVRAGQIPNASSNPQVVRIHRDDLAEIKERMEQR